MPNRENPTFLVTHDGRVVQWADASTDEQRDYFDEVSDQQGGQERSKPDKGSNKHWRKKGRGNQNRN